MKRLFLLLIFAWLSMGILQARIGTVLNGRGEVINHSGRPQPVLKIFFGVELRSTSVNVAKVILEERYGQCLYEGKPSNYTDSHSLNFKVFWYDQPVTARFYFKNFNGKWLLDWISIQCDANTTRYIANQLNRDFGKGDRENDCIGVWGATIEGRAYAIETAYYGKLEGFSIRSN